MSLKFPTRALVNQNDAAIVESPQVQRSRFINNFGRLTAFDAGYIVPFLVDEILPGDHMRYDVTAYVRMATPLYPMFSNQRVDTFFFFVPNRLVWENWVKMMGEQKDISSSINYTTPMITGKVAGEDIGTLHDHMGIPGLGQISAGESVSYNALPFRAYELIWNEWFRDENSVGALTLSTGDGPDAYSDYALQKRAKSHDYFTSALPWPQKFTAPTVPILGTAPITGIGKGNTAAAFAAGAGITPWETGNTPGTLPSPTPYTTGGAASTNSATAGGGAASANEFFFKLQTNGAGAFWPAIYADLTQATGVAINTLRQAWLIQSLLERDARGGTRYVELIRSHFGVTNPDFRLQRPEYIGGGQTPLNLTPIAQTAPTTGVPLGALGAAGTASGQHVASYAATEHGFILGLINVRSELAYQQGLHKMWSRSTRYDYYWPSLAGLGEQAILRQEIWCNGGNTSDATVFGYQERWHEYRTRYSDVTGIMRSTAAGTLDAWHLAQKFTGAPVLGATFLEDTPPMSRVLAAGSLAAGQQYIADINIQRTAVRPIPMFGTPAQLGRF